MADLLTNAQATELQVLLDNFPTAPVQGLLPEEFVARVNKVLSEALTNLGVTTSDNTATRERLSQNPWLHWVELLTVLNTEATPDLWTDANKVDDLDGVYTRLRDMPPERPMGLPDGDAVVLARILDDLTGLSSDLENLYGLSVLEAVKQHPVALWILTVLAINDNASF